MRCSHDGGDREVLLYVRYGAGSQISKGDVLFAVDNEATKMGCDLVC